MFSQSFRLDRSVHVLTALAVASILASPAASAAAPNPLVPADLILNTTVRQAAVEPEPGAVAAVRFRLEMPQAGLLALDLTVAPGAQPVPVLQILDFSLAAGGRADGAVRRIAQTPTALLVEAREAGELVVEVTALEQDQGLPAFRLRSAFAATDSVPDGSPEDAVDPWDDDLPGKKPPQTGSGGSAPQLVLRDGDGLAVAVARSESAGTPLRLARALAAGRYFLAVESPAGDYAYALTLHRPGRP